MINCEKCGKQNQDHYKFCLGCGAELPRKDAPKPFSPQTPPQGVPTAGNQAATEAQPSPAAAAPEPGPAVAAGPVAAAPPQPSPLPVAQAAPAGPTSPPAQAYAGMPTVACPQCGQANPQTNKFCASCGYNLAASVSQPPVAMGSAPPGVDAGASTVCLTALRADGSEAGRYNLPESQAVTVGRDTGSIFAGDSYLSPRHATFTRRGADVLVKDEGSLNGVYIKLKANEPWPLGFSDIFRIGQEIIRFEALKGQGTGPDEVERFGSPAKGFIGRLSLVVGRDTTGNSFPVPEQGIHCGRERGDVLFSEDGYVSGLHCRVAKSVDGKIYLTDVGSSNGTFARLTREHPLASGDILLMGQQLFRIDY